MPRHQPVQLEQHTLAARHRLAARAFGAAELAVGEAVLLACGRTRSYFSTAAMCLARRSGSLNSLVKPDVVAVKRIGVQVAADHDRRVRRERLFDLIIYLNEVGAQAHTPNIVPIKNPISICFN